MERTAEQPSTTNTLSFKENVEQQLLDHLSRVKAALYESIVGFYGDGSNGTTATTYRHHSDYYDELNALDDELQAAHHRAQLATDSGSPSASIVTRITAETVQESSSLLLVAKIHNILYKMDDLFDQFDVVEAASAIQDVELLLDQTRAHADPFCWKLMKDEYGKKWSRAKFMLHQVLQRQFTLSQHRGVRNFTMHKRIQRAGVNHLTYLELLSAIQVLGFLEEELGWLGRSVMLKFFEQYMNLPDRGPLTLNESKLTLTIAYEDHQLNVVNKGDERSRADKDPWQVLPHMAQLIAHFTSVMFDVNNAESFAQLCMYRQAMLPELRAFFQKHILAPTLPGDFECLHAYMEKGSFLLQFHAVLVECRFLSSSDVLVPDFTQTVEKLFTQRKRQEVMSMVRQWALCYDGNTVEVQDATERGGIKGRSASKAASSNSDALQKGKGKGTAKNLIHKALLLPKCKISSATHTVMEMVYQTLFEAEQMFQSKSYGKSAATEIFFIVRDILDLWRSLMPAMKAASSTGDDARKSAVFLNDCNYICYHLATMTYGVQLADEPIQSLLPLIDMIHAYRLLGQEQFEDALALVRQDIDQSLEILLMKAGNGAVVEPIQRSSMKLCKVLIHLQSVWKDIFATDFYMKSMSTLVDYALSGFLGGLFNVLVQLTPDDSYLVRSALLKLDGTLKTCFTKNSDSSTNDATPLTLSSSKWSLLNDVITFLTTADLYGKDRVEQVFADQLTCTATDRKATHSTTSNHFMKLFEIRFGMTD